MSQHADSVSVQAEPHGEVELRTIAMPADTNVHGDIFGGWLLGQMDLAAGAHAVKRSRGRVVTVALDSMSFHRPVRVGDQVSCYCEIRHVGNTSLSVHVETWVCRRAEASQSEVSVVKVTEGVFTFVALEADGSKRQVPRD